MITGKILVQKVNMEEIDLEVALVLHKKVKETLPDNIKAVIIPDTWKFIQVDDKVIYIGMDSQIDLGISTGFIDAISETLGEGYTIVTNLCRAEVIDERY